jgi:Kae1-associated kinase Bud32
MKITYLDRDAIIKERFSKTYRHPVLDQKLTQRRVKDEAKCIARAQRAGIDTPAVYLVDLTRALLYMEYVDGPMVKSILQQHQSGVVFKQSEADKINRIDQSLDGMLQCKPVMLTLYRVGSIGR